MKKLTKNILLPLEYLEGKDRTEDNYFEGGGVQDPLFSNELKIWIEEDESFDENQERFIKSELCQINIGGSKRSLFEFGKYLIALSEYETEDLRYSRINNTTG